ncbi:MAG: hypothetical protein K6T56_00960 [Burkholderiales bacterium]|nr:hypothetical protein [Burkholderiales bacterium]
MAARPRRAPPWAAAEPLWKRVPTRDEAGRYLTDLIMWVPGLRDRPEAVGAALEAIHLALLPVPEVVFAEFNLARNLLWVSLRVRRGITLEVAARIRERLPEARLIGEKRFF